MAETETLSEELAQLELRLGATGAMTAAFEGELARLSETVVFSGREVSRLSHSFSGSLRRAFDGLVFDGVKASEALKDLGQSLAANIYATATKPVFDAAGGALAQGMNGLISGLLPFAKGGAFTGGRVTPFAKGGVVASATTFPMRGGVGLMGEAGPEAIMPLSRGADGRLGVVASAGGRGGANGGTPIIMHISTPDAASFRRSEAQIAAQMARALAQGQRNR